MKSIHRSALTAACFGLAISTLLVPVAQAASFQPTGSMGTARWFHKTVLLSNGKVLVAGGADSSFNAFASAEVFDPVTGTWAGTSPMALARYQHTATMLPNGKVLVAGGHYNNSALNITNTAELYDPATGTWTATASMTSTFPLGNIVAVC